MREAMVTDLVRDVLGPRGRKSSFETMHNDPYDEFITGVLEPSNGGTNHDSVTSQHHNDPGIGYGQDEIHGQDDRDLELARVLSPPLDPRKRANTMGITFTAKALGPINVKVCLTWARYAKKNHSSVETWERLARWSIFDLEVPDMRRSGKPYRKTKDITEFNGVKIWEEDAEISLKIRARKTAQSTTISLFMINKLHTTKGRAETCIFQPQIRINHTKDTEIVPLSSSVTDYEDDTDDGTLEYLYRNEQVFARGHLVSAIWKKVDPEDASNDPQGFEDARSEPPFRWVDGDVIPPERKEGFDRPPDIRTEYVPIYQVPLPDIGWNSDLEPRPELFPSKLAEIWEGQKLRRALIPLYDKYASWVSELKDGSGKAHARLAGERTDAANRILEGINILTDSSHPLYSSDIVLSFCFANKVMALQARWAGNDVFEYRPFQIAFVLMCLESVVNPNSKFRDVCDLMWVPTGTGKTEAYLLLAAFTFSYRRRRALTSSGEKTGAGVSVLTRYTLRLLTIQQFRRTLSVTTAAEFLRTHGTDGTPSGWRPDGYPDDSKMIWGSTPFSTGLWIGSSMEAMVNPHNAAINSPLIRN